MFSNLQMSKFLKVKFNYAFNLKTLADLQINSSFY
jgi:hypothetical protein